MTGALLCSLGVVRDELVEEEEGDVDGMLEESLSPLLVSRTEWPTLVSMLLGFGKEFSERHKQIPASPRICRVTLHYAAYVILK